MNPFVKNLVDGLASMLRSPVGLHEPEITDFDIQTVAECLNSGYVSVGGDWQDRFEAALREYTGSPHVIATSSGTAALHLALICEGIGPGDEVLVPAMSFVATANAVKYAGAEPHFIDINLETICVASDQVRTHLRQVGSIRDGVLRNKETGRRIAGLVVMHTFGLVADTHELANVACEFGISIIEDAAEALGSWAGSHHAGTVANTGILSFNGNKIVTSGGGGAVLTNDLTLAKRARHLAATAKRPHPWDFYHDEVGYNYRMPNLNASLGLSQLSRLRVNLEKKRANYRAYEKFFSEFEGAQILGERPGTSSNFWLCAVRLDTDHVQLRNEVLNYALTKGIGLRPAWRLLPLLPPFKSSPSSGFEAAKELEASILCLPSGVDVLNPEAQWGTQKSGIIEA